MPVTREDVIDELEANQYGYDYWVEFKKEGKELTAIETRSGKRYLIEVKVYPLELC